MVREPERDNVRLLSAFPQLVAIDDAAWRAAVETAKPVSVPANASLMTAEAHCRDFLLLYAGVVRVEEVSASGRDIVLYRVHPGEICILTILSLMEGAPFNARAVAETPIEGLAISLERFEQALAQSPGFRKFILTTMAGRLCEVMRLVQEIAFQRLDERLAATLYELFEHHRNGFVQITHQQLAAELGSTREAVSRLLKEFEDKTGCIRLHRGRIELVSRSALAAYSQQRAAAG